MSTEREKVNCLKCQHFYVTWNKNTPKGCRAYQIQSARLPSLEVELASGKCCQAFQEKLQNKKVSNK